METAKMETTRTGHPGRDVAPRKSYYVQLKEAAAAGDPEAVRKFDRLRNKQKKADHRRRAAKNGNNKVPLFRDQDAARKTPQRRKKKTKSYKRPSLRPAAVESVEAAFNQALPEQMRVVLKAGSQVSLTVGGISLTVVAEK